MINQINIKIHLKKIIKTLKFANKIIISQFKKIIIFLHNTNLITVFIRMNKLFL